MKKTIIQVQVLIFTFLLLVVSSAMAIPVYTGDVDRTDLEAARTFGKSNPKLPAQSGYYIWSNDPARTSWSVRWTGNNNSDSTDPNNYNSPQWLDWFGSVEFLGNDMMTWQAVDWDNHDGDIEKNGNKIEFELAKAGWAWDGFDFTLNPSFKGTLRFKLGGTLYSNLLPASETSATAMWIGMNTPDVKVVREKNGRVYQIFDTPAPAPVPEPATIFLFGVGLIGLAGTMHRKIKKQS